MLLKLKRIADTSGGERPEGGWPVERIEVMHAGPKQNFSPRIIEKAVSEGWATLKQGRIILHTVPELTYNIVRKPGLYCCYCGIELSDQVEARAHVETVHSNAESPDPQNPAGYRDDRFYACEKVED